jgi:hypothetical protein
VGHSVVIIKPLAAGIIYRYMYPTLYPYPLILSAGPIKLMSVEWQSLRYLGSGCQERK